ncbi:MAG: 5-(carboxyamino)imidazole ribonucleotide synthase [Myxococcales bacterium]|nr:5-(carboxyamino)imidazole ribonucleotide synthase [Myxococcota bacterium]MDW8282700.1 5-(carboxyamino)imidazole ribonucleotide synthase [Myxococcales bacterium]
MGPGAILPGATLGIFGGGQLGRMTAMAARTLGYHVLALDPDAACAARGVVDRCLCAAFDDPEAAAELGRAADVVTLEIERVARHSLEAAARHAPVRPGAAVLAVVQDRAVQKDWLAQHGFPVGPWRRADSAQELAEAAAALGACFAKVRTGGYDGRGQARLGVGEPTGPVWQALGQRPLVVEQALALAAELSVLVARSPAGQTVVYPPAMNHHVDRVLDWSVLPGPLPEQTAEEAMDMARAIATALAVEGLLAVELFLTTQGRLLVNELAPRPHNTFHGTQLACLTDQFEQLVRAVCGLPLGAVAPVRPAAIVNLLGDLWLPAPDGQGGGPDYVAALQVEGVRLHLYGKGPPRPGRKMGHLSAVGSTPQEALDRVLRARARLARHPAPPPLAEVPPAR